MAGTQNTREPTELRTEMSTGGLLDCKPDCKPGRVDVLALAVPVLAGSAAFAVSEARGGKRGLEYQPWQAVRFYSMIVVATMIGVGLALSASGVKTGLFCSPQLHALGPHALRARTTVRSAARRPMQ